MAHGPDRQTGRGRESVAWQDSPSSPWSPAMPVKKSECEAQKKSNTRGWDKNDKLYFIQADTPARRRYETVKDEFANRGHALLAPSAH